VGDLRTSLLSADSAVWGDVLTQVLHDFYHLPAYVDLMARHEGGEPCAFLAEDGDGFFFLPLILRPLTVTGATMQQVPEARDAISPYGYPCPLVKLPSSDCERGRFLDMAIAALKAEMARQGVCCALVRLHPLLETSQRLLLRWGTVTEHGTTVYIDLSLSEEEMWGQTRKDHRSHIKKLQRAGVEVYIDECWQHLEDFRHIYYETMEDAGADGYYYFGKDFFEELGRSLKEYFRLVLVENKGIVMAGGLFGVCTDIVETFLTGTSRTFRASSPHRLLYHFVRSWAKRQGKRVFHLGGGVGCRQDGLFRYKAGFSESRGRFATWRLVFDKKMYAWACRAWEDAAGVEADDMSGFFPAYRKHIPYRGA
jgi:hypothetical protein